MTEMISKQETVDIIETLLLRWDETSVSNSAKLQPTSRVRAWYIHDGLIAMGVLPGSDDIVDRYAQYMVLSGVALSKEEAIMSINAAINSMREANYTGSGWLNEFIDKCKQKGFWFHRTANKS